MRPACLAGRFATTIHHPTIPKGTPGPMLLIMECTKSGVVKKEREDTVIDSVVTLEADPSYNGGEIRAKLTHNVAGDWLSRRFEVGKFYKIEIDPRAVEDLRPYAVPGKDPAKKNGDAPPLVQYARLVDKANKSEDHACPRCAHPAPYNGKNTWVCKNDDCGVDTFDTAFTLTLGDGTKETFEAEIEEPGERPEEKEEGAQYGDDEAVPSKKKGGK